jgi:hypothetical protein
MWDTGIVQGAAAKALVAADLAAFERHKKALLENLRKVCERGHKSKPFDADKSWDQITLLAKLFFLRAIKIKQETVTILPARRIERLRDIAKALGRARSMVNKAQQDDVGHDLFDAWNDISAASGIGSNGGGRAVPFFLADEFEEVVAGLTTLEKAACKAADWWHTKPGPREGAGRLPPRYIKKLEEVYRNSTGRVPGERGGGGPFTQFVREFLDAIGQGDDITGGYVVEAIKYARKRAREQARKNPGS